MYVWTWFWWGIVVNNKKLFEKVENSYKENGLSSIIELFEIENSKDFENAFKANLQNYKSYKQTYEQTFKDLKLDTDLIDLFNKPNFTLAYQYFKAIKNHFTNIKFNLIQRTNSYDDESLNSNVVSAKAIRYAVVNNLTYNQYLPFDEKLINLSDAEKLLHNLIKYHCVLDYKYNDNKDYFLEKIELMQ